MNNKLSIISDIVNFPEHIQRVRELNLLYDKSTTYEQFLDAARKDLVSDLDFDNARDLVNARDPVLLPARARGQIYLRIFAGGDNKHRNPLHIWQLVNDYYFVEAVREYNKRIETKINDLAGDVVAIIALLKSELAAIDTERNNALLMPVYTSIDPSKQTGIDNITVKFFKSCSTFICSKIKGYDQEPEASQIDPKFAAQLLIFEDLGLLDAIRPRMKDTGAPSKNLAKLIKYLTGNTTTQGNVKNYLDNVKDPEAKNTPWTKPAKKMAKEVYIDCGLTPPQKFLPQD